MPHTQGKPLTWFLSRRRRPATPRVLDAVPFAQLRGAGAGGDEHVAAGLPGGLPPRGRSAGRGASRAGERADPRLQPLPRLPLVKVH